MQLRNYQKITKDKIYSAWNSGAQYVGVQLPTGSGKTVLFTNIVAETKAACILIAHRHELVSQISLALAMNNIRHNIIAQKQTIKNIIALHMFEFKKSFYDPYAKTRVAGVDTLIKLEEPWFQQVRLIIVDEAHHVLKNNKWGKVISYFPNARGLFPTATPIRADGYGLGRHADGFMDVLINGPSMRELIDSSEHHLCDYRIVVPPSDLDLSGVSISASGDYSPQKLRSAVHRSHITGDVVKHYKKFANGKLGITFAVDIEAANEIAQSFKNASVPAELITGNTPALLRAQIMQRFRNREILQLVNVDILGEGVDVPAIEVVSMARPTQSYSLYVQQFGRALRPTEGKEKALIIDHVSNVYRHGLPDRVRVWSLDRRERRSRSTPDDVIPIRVCLNPECMLAYERLKRECPYCGFYSAPQQRSSPEFVDGDLLELDEETLRKLRGEIDRIDNAARVPQNLDSFAQRAVIKRHDERQRAQRELRNSIALWAGYYKSLNKEDFEIYRLFYFNFGLDVATAQTLNAKDASELKERINGNLIKYGINL